MPRKKKKVIGICGLCGEHKEMSFEHYPPEKAFNDKKVFVQSLENLYPIGNPHLVGKKGISRRGFGGHTLCIQCNTITGGFYANAYIDFAKQAVGNLNQLTTSNDSNYKLQIRPLNIFKQIVTIFLSVDRNNGFLRKHFDAPSFLLDKYAKDFPEDLNIYFMLNVEDDYIAQGFMYEMFSKTHKAQFAYPPFRFVMTHDCDPREEPLLPLRHFLNYGYDEYLSNSCDFFGMAN